MTTTLRLTVTALAILVCGLAGMGWSLLTSPYGADPNTTSAGWLFLFLAAAVAGLTVATLRGSLKAWLATCVIAVLIVLVPATYWLSEAAGSLGEAPEDTIRFTATATATATDRSSSFALGELSSFIAFAGAAGAIVLRLRPATRLALTRRRTPPAGPQD
ncbi:hypothetical protein [Paractinoplanes hotanensis]|uniref:Uncharacterized protein n=1 Tax=Paractinoplanes hotanensis TaxID=2906497 RepID=A0ABT0YEN8_9ACTN|nr:hypothetical protein [Actinoplanes hotanensis]MCM4084508.1 hypothetical protein [Actinoplanes hotanensis]